MDRDGEIDPDPGFGGDDDLLGCARTDSSGDYDLSIGAFGEDAGKELYLVTWFCDQADAPLTILHGATLTPRATACVRFNAQSPSARRKTVHSREQELVWNQDNFLNWNLSCPNVRGEAGQVKEVACSEEEEEESAGAGSTNHGRTNSSSAWNKEFGHVFRTAAQASSQFLSLKPHVTGVATSGCGIDGQQKCVPCDLTECLKPVEFVITPAIPENATPLCAPEQERGEALGYDIACVLHGADGRLGTLNPFQPLHTLGHLLLRRWLKSTVDVPDRCQTVTWNRGNDEAQATVEGYANFVAVVAWFSDAATDIEYEGIRLVGSPGADFNGTCGPGSTCTCSEGELNGAGRVTRFFVDLWDRDDEVNIMSSDILRVWSTFDQPRESAECAPDGRNLADFREHYLALVDDYPTWQGSTAFDKVAASSCVDRHRHGMSACGPSASCEAP